MRLLLVIAGTLLMIGCSVLKEPPSPIVQKTENCGAGDLSATSETAVQVWFGKHRDCGVAVDAMCKPIRERAPARWSDSMEGHVCAAAGNIGQ